MATVPPPDTIPESPTPDPSAVPPETSPPPPDIDVPDPGDPAQPAMLEASAHPS